MARFGVVLDACTLVPISLTATMLSLAEMELFQPIWSERILDETLRALTKIYPNESPLKFEARIVNMKQVFPEALVRGWENLEPGISAIWPDPNDAHVVAAAIRGRAELIVTENIKDFPPDLLAEFGLHALVPDDFLLDLWDLNRDAVVKALVLQAERTNNPALSVQKILKHLKNFAPKFSSIARLSGIEVDN